MKSLENAEKNPKAIESWIESINELHRCKPPATVHYSRWAPRQRCRVRSGQQEQTPERQVTPSKPLLEGEEKLISGKDALFPSALFPEASWVIFTAGTLGLVWGNLNVPFAAQTHFGCV